MDLRKKMNYISDVVMNRPSPIREVDQIYMKHGDMLLQVEYLEKWIVDKHVVFIGDGDAISLCLAYLQYNRETTASAKSILVLDFDERIVNAINRFAKNKGFDNLIDARLYNVADPLPIDLWKKYDFFYCNPPYGSSNSGISIHAFIKRGLEATKNDSSGCVVLADYEELYWTKEVLHSTQEMALANGCIVAEMLPKFHTYHLDDMPNLTSCNIIFRKINYIQEEYKSEPLTSNELENFYGEKHHLTIKYVKNRLCKNDDYVLVLMNGDENSGE